MFTKKRERKYQCQNPLFLKWLQEWKDDAERKGLNSQWTYQKAINSIKKYPLPLRSGKDAIILENVGDMIATKLDKALAEYIANGGDFGYQSQNKADGKRPSPNDVYQGKKRQRKDASSRHSIVRYPKADSELDMSCCHSGSSDVAKSNRRIEYVPKPGSGAYALMLTLFRESKNQGSRGSMTKEELQQKAESLSQKSFTTADPGSYYTAWSSMSTILKKGLVVKSNKPAKYSLTDSGIELARKLDLKYGTLSLFPNRDIVPIDFTAYDNTTSADEVLTAIPTTSHSPATGPVNALNRSLRFWYVNSTGHLSVSKNDAVIEIDESKGDCMFLIKCKESDLSLSPCSFKVDNSRSSEDGFVYAFLADQDAAEVSIPPDIEHGNFSSNDANSILANCTVLPGTKTISVDRGYEALNDSSKLRKLDDDQYCAPASNNIDKRSCDSPLFVMKQGSFEIILCVDNCEVTAGSKASSKKLMLDHLKKLGVPLDIRKLQLGDFLWIARGKENNDGECRELILDFIVERKRMDDLAGSIIDGRFKEQKFRLKSCGLKHIIYLVESFGSAQHMVLPESNLRQAFINSQVIDDLFVRKTENTYDSAEYLAQVTRLLKSVYEKKTLVAFPMDYAITLKEHQNYKQIMAKPTQNLFTFEEFNQHTAKNKILNVKAMFAKQLMQLKGVSSEKAASIVKLYPTPKCLSQALQQCKDGSENLLTNVTVGRAKRKIGPITSKEVQILYESNVPLT